MSYDLCNLDRPVVIFELDDQARNHFKFLRAMDKAAAVGRVKHPIEQGMGHWESQNNVCYVMDQADFVAMEDELRAYHIGGQDAIMQAHPKGGLGAALGLIVKNDDSHEALNLGRMQKVDPHDLAMYVGFTILKSGCFVLDC